MEKIIAVELEVENYLIITSRNMEMIDFFEAALFAACFGLNAGDFKGFPIENKEDLI